MIFILIIILNPSFAKENKTPIINNIWTNMTANSHYVVLRRSCITLLFLHAYLLLTKTFA